MSFNVVLTLFLDPLSDSGGLHFPKAIFQLMIGLYCLEGCMVGLFLTSGITSNSLNMWLAAIMIISVVSTGIFHYRLQSVFVPIVKYLPMALYNTGRDTTSKVESSIRSSGLTSNSRKPSSRKTSIRSASEFLHETSARFVPKKHSQNFNSPPAENATFALDTSEISGHLNSTSEESNIVIVNRERQVSMRGYYKAAPKSDTSFESLTNEQKEYITKSAYNHYSLRESQPCIWIPQDSLGISEDQINEIRMNYSNILISSDGCTLDEDGNITLFGNPPDWNPMLKMQL